MKTVPIETVDTIWEQYVQLEEKEVRELACRMKSEQPFILVYLLAMEEGLKMEKGRLTELVSSCREVAAFTTLR